MSLSRPAPAVRDHPVTSRAAAPDDGVDRPRFFDPALRQYTYAFRRGDPTFADADAGRRWVDARRRATDHVLRMRVAGAITPVVRAAARYDLLDFVSREPSLEETFLAQYGADAAAAPEEASR